MKPTAGKVIINETDIFSMNPKELDAFRGKNIGIVFQKSHFMEALTVEENLAFCRKLAGLDSNKNRITEVLNRLAIPHKAKKYPSDLSQGEQQRLSIARAIISAPAVLLAAEPSSALEDENCMKVIELLNDQVTYEKCSLIIVTHDHRISQQFPNQIKLSQKSVAI